MAVVTVPHLPMRVEQRQDEGTEERDDERHADEAQEKEVNEQEPPLKVLN